MARGASEMGQMYGEEAANSFAAGVQNIRNPFAAFDAGFAQAQADAQAASLGLLVVLKPLRYLRLPPPPGSLRK